MRRILSLSLTLLLLLAACAPAQPAISQAALSADEVARAVLAACGEDPERLTTLEEQLGGGDVTAYLDDFYGLPAGSWDDCAVYLSPDPVSAFEVSVFRLTAQADADAVLEGLEAYRLDRQGAFTGYAPDQAALAEGGAAVLSGGGDYAALLICEDADAARDAFYAALEQSAPTVSSPAATNHPAVYAGRVPYTDPGVDDMTVYDTSAILAAWRSGDPSSLSEHDRAIYDRASAVLEEVLSDGMSGYEKERAIYTWLTANVAYDYDHYSLFAQVSRDSFTPYNPLVEGKGVCLGFASTFQLLMDMAGVECLTVVGAAFDSREDHAWNMVRLDREWYCVDATWDTGVPEGYWSYFNVTSDYMAATDHQWDYASVPEATANDGGRV